MDRLNHVPSPVTILFAPLIGCLICGFTHRIIGEKAATYIATGFLFLSDGLEFDAVPFPYWGLRAGAGLTFETEKVLAEVEVTETLAFAPVDLRAQALGVTLTESCAMMPAASVSGWYLSHPEARYFGVGRLGRDQVEDYAGRVGMTVEETERWLRPNLGYEPEPSPAGAVP